MTLEIISKNNPEWNYGHKKIYESDIDVKSNKLTAFQRNVNNITTKDWIIIDVIIKILFLKKNLFLLIYFLKKVSISCKFH